MQTTSARGEVDPHSAKMTKAGLRGVKRILVPLKVQNQWNMGLKKANNGMTIRS
ncbi:hypothetical protein SAMN05216232_3641 [Virgibacillus subterraneus]|uniref:Uncharacterized protein n=3 Tax=Bacillaceae TaxID=186817 RepID=A0A1H1DPQ8_9BACI|nr:hypothetical protein SAMN05216231_2514 [Virgibacillus salinus]SEQ90334.1 hypothetical protein SAMN05216232_3641 [Virgibacillus subterraneus]